MAKPNIVSALGMIVALMLPPGALYADSSEPPSARFSERDNAILRRGEIARSAYLSGAIVGTMFSFGIGQAIQGRYRETGWIVTAGEAAGIGLIALGWTSKSDLEAGKRGSSALGFAGALLLIGTYAFDLADLWFSPPLHNERYRSLKGKEAAESLGLHFDPSANSAVAGLRVAF